ELICQGKNLFFHASGGTGKTYMINKICSCMRQTRTISVCTPTGKAAVVLGCGAQTINRRFNIPSLNKDTTDEELLALAIKISKKLKKVMDMIIIDLDFNGWLWLMTILDEILKIKRKNDLPFGGVQLIVSGDFYQLPPVLDKWCFESRVWDNLNFVLVEFNTSKRYGNGRTFDFLQRLRKGELIEEDRELIMSRKDAMANSEWRKHKISPTILFATNGDADSYNASKLNKLEGELHKKRSIDAFYPQSKDASENKRRLDILNDMVAPLVTYKIKAKVMICKNIDAPNKLVNGMTGVIIDINEDVVRVRIEDGTEHGIVPCIFKYSSNRETFSRIQYPFILAWAMTIHKSQGSTLNYGIIKMENIRTRGQAYVAFSRFVDIENVY
ncbi:unnamed protein product, partial [Ascophyllum nodosum]